MGFLVQSMSFMLLTRIDFLNGFERLGSSKGWSTELVREGIGMTKMGLMRRVLLIHMGMMATNPSGLKFFV